MPPSHRRRRASHAGHRADRRGVVRGTWHDVHGSTAASRIELKWPTWRRPRGVVRCSRYAQDSSGSSRRCRRSSRRTPNRRAEGTACFGSTTTYRSSTQSGARERLSEMGRHQSAQNARRFSPRRRPAERTRCPSCRLARGRGEPLLRPGAVGAARSSRHAESLACAARAFTSPSRFNSPIIALIGPSTCDGCRRGRGNPSQKRSIHEDTGESIRGDSSVRGEQSRRIAPYRRERDLSVTASPSPAQGKWRRMTATSTVQHSALLATPPSRSVPCLCRRTTRRVPRLGITILSPVRSRRRTSSCRRRLPRTSTAKLTLIATTCAISCSVVTRRFGGMYVAMIVVPRWRKQVA
jgi:hypothetical protein